MFFAVRDLSVSVRENITLSIILNDNINLDSQRRIKQYLENMGYAKEIEYVSKEAALQHYIESRGEDPKSVLDFNPLKASLEVKLNARYTDPDSIKMIESKLKRFESINHVAYQEDMISLVNKNIHKISFVLLGLALALLTVSVALIHNTVQLMVYSNRFIINTMKLVGANRGFIRKPYIKRGIINGFMAAILALILISLLVIYAMPEFDMSVSQIQPHIILLVSAIVIVSGIVLTALSSYIAVGRYLRMKTGDIYYA